MSRELHVTECSMEAGDAKADEPPHEPAITDAVEESEEYGLDLEELNELEKTVFGFYAWLSARPHSEIFSISFEGVEEDAGEKRRSVDGSTTERPTGYCLQFKLQEILDEGVVHNLELRIKHL